MMQFRGKRVLMAANKSSDFAIFRRVLNQVKPFWPRLTAIFLLDLLSTPLALLVPVPLKIAVDSVIGNAPLPGIIASFKGDQRGL